MGSVSANRRGVRDGATGSAAFWTRWRTVWLPLLVCEALGCDATLQAFGAHSLGAPQSTHAGPMFEGRIHLPRRYDWVAGVEAGHLMQVDPSTVADQWRFGVIGGYSELAQPLRSRVSTELTLRLGLFRGSHGGGPLVPAGLYGGFAAAIPIRISATKDPWELDDLVLSSWSIVPHVGLNGLVPELRFADTTPELSVGLGVRASLSSSLLP